VLKGDVVMENFQEKLLQAIQEKEFNRMSANPGAIIERFKKTFNKLTYEITKEFPSLVSINKDLDHTYLKISNYEMMLTVEKGVVIVSAAPIEADEYKELARISFENDYAYITRGIEALQIEPPRIFFSRRQEAILFEEAFGELLRF
jgi:hypothetical protein